MTHVTCKLTAKNRDQLRNPTLGNRVWVSFTTLVIIILLLFPQILAIVAFLLLLLLFLQD